MWISQVRRSNVSCMTRLRASLVSTSSRMTLFHRIPVMLLAMPKDEMDTEAPRRP